MKKIIASVLGLATIVLCIYSFNSITKGGIFYVAEIHENPDSLSSPEVQTASKEEIVTKYCETLRNRYKYIGVTKEKVYSLEQEGFPNRVKIEIQEANDTVQIKKLSISSVSLELWETYSVTELPSNLMSADSTLRSLLANEIQVSTTTNFQEEEEINEAMETIKIEHPLLSLLHSNSGAYGESPIIGFANIRDTATINAYLSMPQIRMEFPKDLRFIWGAFPAESDRTGNIFELYTIKSTESNGKAPLKEDIIINAEGTTDNYGKPCLDIAMNPDGADRWARMTRSNIGRAIAIVVNNYVYFAPNVNSEITGGRSQVTGHFTEEEVRDLACMLKFSAMPASVTIVEEGIIPDTEWSISKPLWVCTLILGLAFVFMLIKIIRDK